MVEIGVYFLPLGASGCSIEAGFSGTNFMNTVHCFLSGCVLARLLPPVRRTSMFLNFSMCTYAVADEFTLCGNSAQRSGCL